MVIDDLNTLRMTISPEKADPPLVIDANALRALAIPLQHFKSIRRRQSKIFQSDSRINRIELHESPLLNLILPLRIESDSIAGFHEAQCD